MISALANHLWQSSMFATGAAALAVILRRNSAAVRYRIWFAASIKFLIPFSILTGIAGRFTSPPFQQMAPSVAVIAGLSQPFESQGTAVTVLRFPTAESSHASLIFPVLAALWICGTLAFCARRWRQIRRVRAIVRQSTPLGEGRELEIMNRALTSRGMPSVPLISCRTETEPGVFGIFRPVLLLPRNITLRLSDSELEGIFTHEICHVRRRDNLTAFAHSIVETAFWFHPLVWWIGGRLFRERERACDENTLQNGCSRRSYASGILKVCEFCVPAERALVSGITGSGLRKRIEEIMNYQICPELSFAKKALLFGAMTTAIGGPILFGLAGRPVQAQAPQAAAFIRSAAAPFSSSPILPQGQRGQQSPRPNPQPAPATAPATAIAPQILDLANWANSEVGLIATEGEVRAFKNLASDEERRRFIEEFWRRRDPTPDTAENEIETEFYTRVAYANDHFSGSVPGSESDRGKMYILNGPPDEVISHIGGTFFSSRGNNNFTTNTFPFETWRYRHLNKSENVIYEFVDSKMSGDYKLEYDPSAKNNPLPAPAQ